MNIIFELFIFMIFLILQVFWIKRDQNSMILIFFFKELESIVL